MRLLLDTHVLLQAAGTPERLSPAARALLNDPEHLLLFSSASLWEIVIKNELGRADFRVEPRLFRRALLDNGYQELPITSAHVLALCGLPPLHRDPFDRILVAQSIQEGIPLYTLDRQVAQYPAPVRCL